MGLLPGITVELTVGPPAHGGSCVARHEGQVVFIRHALPGERVRALVTEGNEGSRFVRADAVDVVQPSPDRVEPPCRLAGPGGCGGCDLQHLRVPAQRSWKAQVVAEQFRRLAGMDVDVQVEAIPGDQDGLAWRTRVELTVGSAGRPGLRQYRSHEIVPVNHCPIATSRIDALIPGLPSAEPGTAYDLVDPAVGEPVTVSVPASGIKACENVATVTERVHSRAFEVSARGFWQVHPGAATTFVDTVLSLAGPKPGECCLDLYAGVGLFAVGLAEAVGVEGQVVLVESDDVACANAQANLAGFANAVVAPARVDDALGVARPARRRSRSANARPGRRGSQQVRLRSHPLMPLRADVVVLDPPRTGAGRDVLAAVVGLEPRVITYVACDPAALARDTAYLAGLGWTVTGLRAFDAFPMTHHVECIARFEPATSSG
ncbi:MAG: class I SAM-dependent RNA methyltransferase [Nostocoides sp.]